MDLKAEKLNLIQKILLIEDERLIEFLKKFVQSGAEDKLKSDDFWHELTDYDKKMIEQSFQDYEEGKILSNKDVMSELRKQFSR